MLNRNTLACTIALREVLADGPAVRRAYKLGKKRWSYNQCALTLQQRGGFKTLSVAEAMSNGHQSLPEDQQV